MDRPSAIYESEKQLKALADVLEGKEYKNTSATNGESKWLKYIAEQIEKNGVGGSSVQPDWNQNDNAADDYIKNKPELIGKIYFDSGTAKGEIFNDYNKNVATGNNSHAEGHLAKSIGNNSHAEGANTSAQGTSSHAEGTGTTASGASSHAENDGAQANGSGSHAEGFHCAARGNYSHAEGANTIAASMYQHVQGQYNIPDNDNKYAHIVGNGKYAASSNAHTLDWKGNAWYAGTVEGTAMIVKSSTEGSSKRFKITVDDSGVITATEITA